MTLFMPPTPHEWVVFFCILALRPNHDPQQFVIGLGLSLAIAGISFRLKFLTASGAVATFLLASLIFGIGGWPWTIPILTFFVTSSLLSKAGRKKKIYAEMLYEKSNRRDAGQVAANGGIAGMVVVLWYLMPELTWAYAAYVGAIAAVTADTWGTEVGTLLSQKPRSIVTMQKVPPGTSGGVSLAGLAAGAAGALLIGIASFVMAGETEHAVTLIAAAVGAGFVGTVTDSLLGAAVQAKYRCRVCGKETERAVHCGEAAVHESGKTWITNDIVNWACAAVGCIAAVLLFM